MNANIAIAGRVRGSLRAVLPRMALLLVAVLTLYLLAARAATGPADGGEIVEAAPYGKLPLAFEPNAGRMSDGIDFLARSGAGAAHISDSGARVAIDGGKGAQAIGLTLAGAQAAAPRALDRLPGVVNDLHGDDPSRWRTGIATYARVRYSGVYPGIDVDWYGNQRQLEYDFRVAPGADPAAIAVRVTDADRLHLAPNGDILIRKGDATFRQKAPVAYQPAAAGSARTSVSADFRLDGRTVRFDLGRYDRDRLLVIDPTVLSYSSYLGGNDVDAATGIAVDGSGASYVTGRTLSSDFDTSGAAEGDKAGSDAFVAKLTPGGDALVYSTYVGGNNADRAGGITVDSAGAAYVVGTTKSTDFTTVNPIASDVDGTNTDAFVLKLAPAGNALAYSTYLGGGVGDDAGFGGRDEGTAIAVDGSGAAWIAGQTESGNYPTTTGNRIEGNTSETDNSGTGGTRSVVGGLKADVIVSRLNPAGTALTYSTYLGGNEGESASAIAVDPSGVAYVAGTTSSPDFDTTANRIQGPSAARRQFDAFVAKIDPQQNGRNALVYSTYLGGVDYDAAHGIALDDTGAAYITGTTHSSDFDTSNAIEGNDDGPDAFVSKLTPGDDALVYSTFLGGSGADSGNGIAVDSDGVAHITGHTESIDFDRAGAIEGDAGSSDAFVANIAPDGGSLGCSTYLGGSADDRGHAIALDPAGRTYVAGSTDSSDFNREGGLEGDSDKTDAFVSKLDLSGPCEKAGAGPTATSSDRDLRVYVVVLDGLRPTEVNEFLTPNLHELKEDGTWYEQARSVLIAETLPNHAAMMTGTLPERNGIFANDFWEPGDGTPKFRMQGAHRLESETLFTTLEDSCDVSTAAVQSKQYLWRLFSGETPSPSDPIVQRPADYVFNPMTDPAYIINPDDHLPDAQMMSNGFLPWVRSRPATPQFAFLNLGDIDRSGHADTSGPYTAGGLTAFRQGALADTDQLIGSFVEELKEDGAWEETVMIFTSDHGMDWSTPDHRADASVGLQGAPGYQASHVKGYVVNGGGAMLYMQNGVDLKPYAEHLMTKNAINFVATRQKVAPGIPTLKDVGMDHPKAGDIVAFANPGWRFDKELTPESNPIPGNHGHAVTQHSTLFVTGGHPALSDSPHNVPGETVYDPAHKKFAPPAGGPGNLSIAPTVAALFGVEPPPGGYDGQPLAEAFDEGALDSHTPCGAGSKLPPAPDLTIGDVTVPEGDEGTRDATFTVSLSAPYPRAVTADYATTDGSATQPGDYEAQTGTLTFAPNETSKTISVPVKGDTADEADEAFQVKLSNLANANLADASGSATIFDDDDAPTTPTSPGDAPAATGTPQLAIGDLILAEGNAGTRSATFVVSLSRPSADPVTANYKTVDGSAKAGSDYTQTASSLTLAPGVTSATISVPIRGDRTDEPDESFFVDLGDVTGAEAGDVRGEGRILDDDGARSPAGTTTRTRCDGLIATITGTAAANRSLVGTRRRDVIAGMGGADRADGKGRADSICGGSGNDTLRGGRGNDRVKGGAGRDTLNGGTGSDRLVAGPGRDRVLAADGTSDRITCGGGVDVVSADAGDRVARSCEKVKRAPRRNS